MAEIARKNPLPNCLTQQEWQDLPSENRAKIADTVAKYGENKWWLSTDPSEAARYQVFEGILLIDMDVFHQGLGELLGRPVFRHELLGGRESMKAFRAELQQVLREREAGTWTQPSKSEVKEKILESLIPLKRDGKEIRPIPSDASPEVALQGFTREVVSAARIN